MLQDRFVQPIKALIEREPSYGYRTVAHLLGFNKNTVQRVFQMRGWQTSGTKRSTPGSTSTITIGPIRPLMVSPRSQGWTTSLATTASPS